MVGDDFQFADMFLSISLVMPGHQSTMGIMCGLGGPIGVTRPEFAGLCSRVWERLLLHCGAARAILSTVQSTVFPATSMTCPATSPRFRRFWHQPRKTPAF